MWVRRILSRLLFCAEDSVDNVLLHLPVGVINVGVGVGLTLWGFDLLGLGIVLLFGYGFIKYELTQLKTAIPRDKAYDDIQGWLWGIGLTSIGILIWRLV